MSSLNRWQCFLVASGLLLSLSRCAPATADPCKTDNGGCDVNATCTNQGGTATCQCKSGYAGDGVSCACAGTCPSAGDFDGGTVMSACMTNNGGCDKNATCDASTGTVLCTCVLGFTGDGMTCIAVNGCTAQGTTCDTNATCTSISGFYACNCNEGWYGNGQRCDECRTDGTGCSNHATCVQMGAQLQCVCEPHWAGNGKSCVPADCYANNGNCVAPATCSALSGAVRCLCPSDQASDNHGGCKTCGAGYAGDGVKCNDIDECATKTAMCDPNATCTNTPGSFTCKCKAGYTGDGKTCTAT
jgi:hypothetical protein